MVKFTNSGHNATKSDKGRVDPTNLHFTNFRGKLKNKVKKEVFLWSFLP